MNRSLATMVLRLSPLILAGLAIIALIQLGERTLNVSLASFPIPDPVERVSYTIAGAALLAAGGVSIVAGVLARSGWLAVLAGITWFGADIALLAVAAPALRAVAVASTILVLPLVTLLVLSATAIAGFPRALRPGVVIVTMVVVATAVAELLAYAPLYDHACRQACAFPESFVDPGLAARDLIQTAGHLSVVLAGGLLLLVGAAGWFDGHPRTPSRALMLTGAMLTGLGGGTYAAALAVGQSDGLRRAAGDFAWISLLAASVGLALCALGLALEVVRHIRAQQRIHEIAEELAQAPSIGALKTELGQALEDPMLRVGYPIDGGPANVDAAGRAIDLTPVGGQSATRLSRAGSVVATVCHRDDIDGRMLVSAFGPSLLVGLDNERLRAVRLAQLRELRESRARVVELADAERRRIERDLHDGAQQRLLAAAFDMRLARLRAERHGKSEVAGLYAHAEERALAAVEGLRRLCHGIHPQVLSQAGLGPALRALAEEADVPMEVASDITQRPPLPIETAAYEMVRDALAQAGARDASALNVSVAMVGEDLIVETSDGQPEPPEIRLRLADRVGAVGGELTTVKSDHGPSLRAVMPCV